MTTKECLVNTTPSFLFLSYFPFNLGSSCFFTCPVTPAFSLRIETQLLLVVSSVSLAFQNHQHVQDLRTAPPKPSVSLASKGKGGLSLLHQVRVRCTLSYLTGSLWSSGCRGCGCCLWLLSMGDEGEEEWAEHTALRCAGTMVEDVVVFSLNGLWTAGQNTQYLVSQTKLLPVHIRGCFPDPGVPVAERLEKSSCNP